MGALVQRTMHRLGKRTLTKKSLFWRSECVPSLSSSSPLAQSEIEDLRLAKKDREDSLIATRRQLVEAQADLKKACKFFPLLVTALLMSTKGLQSTTTRELNALLSATTRSKKWSNRCFPSDQFPLLSTLSVALS
jgi:hypothetical protein